MGFQETYKRRLRSCYYISFQVYHVRFVIFFKGAAIRRARTVVCVTTVGVRSSIIHGGAHSIALAISIGGSHLDL